MLTSGFLNLGSFSLPRKPHKIPVFAYDSTVTIRFMDESGIRDMDICPIVKWFIK
jgi:hypothetical protein